MVCGSTRPVTNDLPPSNHLADGEESDNLSGHNTDGSPLLAAEVSHPIEGVGWLGAGRFCLLKDGTRSDTAKEVLEIGLESSNITVCGN
jgi:hypothetical protein